MKKEIAAARLFLEFEMLESSTENSRRISKGSAARMRIQGSSEGKDV